MTLMITTRWHTACQFRTILFSFFVFQAWWVEIIKLRRTCSNRSGLPCIPEAVVRLDPVHLSMCSLESWNEGRSLDCTTGSSLALRRHKDRQTIWATLGSWNLEGWVYFEARTKSQVSERKLAKKTHPTRMQWVSSLGAVHTRNCMIYTD